MFLLADILPKVMFFTGCAMLFAILLRRYYRYFGRRPKSTKNDTPLVEAPRPTHAWSGMHSDAAAHIERQKVELHDMARESAGRLDSKIMVLQQLITQSNQQIERMEGLLSELQAAAKE